MKSNKKLSLFLVLLVAFIDWMGVGLVYPMFSSMLFQGQCTSLLPNASASFRGFVGKYPFLPSLVGGLAILSAALFVIPKRGYGGT